MGTPEFFQIRTVMKKISRERWFILAAFVAAAAFFLAAYPYHLMRREQMTLFMYDMPHIVKTYHGAGFLAGFLGDFLEQFFCFKAAGPLIIAILLTAIAVMAYRICRTFAGKGVAFAIAFLMYSWAFLRETDTLFITRYTVATAGYLLCIFAAMKVRRKALRICAVPVFLMAGAWLFGAPLHKDYGKVIGKPDFEYEKLIAMDVEAYRENWDRVLSISESHLMYNEACYLHNLAAAMKGQLADRLLSHPQNFNEGMFFIVRDVTPFSNSAAGEVWYHLGNMTLADQSAMVSLQYSPKHTGARYIKRLAMINLISGEYGSAEKYLKMLDRTLFYRRWARRMTPEEQDGTARAMIEGMRRNLVSEDVVSSSNNYRFLLKELLRANPGNTMAKEYLLCYDLLSCDIYAFMEDYTPGVDSSKLYQEALLIWVNIEYSEGRLPEDVEMDDFGITQDTVDRLQKFYRFPDRYKDTYWYYYTYATGK